MKIIGMLLVFNDEDIIEEVVEHLISQGLELVVLDNGSKDETFKICEKYLGRGILQLKQFETANFIHNHDVLHRMLYHMALSESPDWVFRSDSDEFFESGIPNKNLKEAIEQVDLEGFNLIQFDRFDFFMTDDDNESTKSIKKKLTYYSCHGDCLYRSWKYYPGIRMGTAGGHWPIYPEGYSYKIYPKKFVMRHYTFHSKEQAIKKMADRTRGTSFEQNEMGVNTHIRNILKQDFTRKIDHNLLTKYDEDSNWDYEIKYHPYMDKIPPRREEIFTQDGKLKIKQKTLWEYHMDLQDAQVTIQNLKTLRGLFRLGKKFFIKKFTKN